MKEIQIHPFDLTYEQIAQHKRMYQCPKGALANQFPVSRATLDQVFLSLSRHLQLQPAVWRNILAHLDQSTNDINFSQEDFNSKFGGAKEQKQFRAFEEEQWNVGKKQDLVLMSSKIEFSDFLKAIQRESVLRDILAEHQMYFHSTKRLSFKQETKLITKQALEAITMARQTGNQGKAQIPTVTYLIDNLLMFNFQGVHLCLICFENQSVQVFESNNGHFIYEFSFYDNVFEHIKGSSNQLTDKDTQQQEKDLDLEFKKSGMSRIEFNLMKRKAAREKGEYVPEPPTLSKPVKTHFHVLNSEQQEKLRHETAQRRKDKLKGSAGLDEYLRGFNEGLDPTLQVTLHEQKSQPTIAEEEEPSPRSREHEPHLQSVGSLESPMANKSRTRASPDHQPRWEKIMNQNTEASMRDSSKKIRECCSMHAEAFMRGQKSFLHTSVTQKEIKQGRSLGQCMARGVSAGLTGVSRHRMNQMKVLNKNFGNLASQFDLGGEVLTTTAAGTSQVGIQTQAGPSRMTNVQHTAKPLKIAEQQAVPLVTEHSGEVTRKAQSQAAGAKPWAGRSPQHRSMRRQQAFVSQMGHHFTINVRQELQRRSTLLGKAAVRRHAQEDKKKAHQIITGKSEQAELAALVEQRLRAREAAEAKQPKKSPRPKAQTASVQPQAQSTRVEAPRTVTAVSQKAKLDRQEYCERRKMEREAQSLKARHAVQQRRDKSKKTTGQLLGVLGIDPIAARGETAQRNDRTDANGRHAYGLDHRLFTSEQGQAEAEKEYHDLLAHLDAGMKYDGRYLRAEGERAAARGESRPQAVYNPPVQRTTEESAKVVQEIRKRQNELNNRISNLKEKSDVFSGWLWELDDQQRIDIRKNKQMRAKEEAERKAKRHPLQRENNDENEEPKPTHLLQIRQDMERERKQIQVESSKQYNEREKGKVKKNKNKKQTYPVCMEYYEPYNIAIFGLVSKEIQIHQLKQTGVRRSFFHCQSMRVEHMIVSMTIEQHKGTSNLIVCAGTQSKKKDRSEVVVWILDPKLEFEVLQSHRWTWPYIPGEVDDKIEQQITQVYYKSGCGLIVCSFTGFIEIYDAINVNHSVWDNGKLKVKSGGGSISTVCYSEALDIIAYAGVSGKIFVLDQTTKNPNGQIQAHKGEVIMLRFFDQQHQLISVSQTGEVGLWDAQKLTKIQLLRNGANMSQKVISACSFYDPLGRVLMATTKIFNYDLDIDSAVKIKTDQQNAIARDYLRQFRKQLVDAGLVASVESPAAKQSASVPGLHSANQFNEILTEEEYVADAYRDSSLKNCLPCGKEFNSSVLASNKSKLVGLIMDKVAFQLFTIDSDLLVRVWNCASNECVRSYFIETREDQLREANQKEDEPDLQKVEKKKAQLVRSDVDIKFLLVAFEAGEVQVNNLYTGALIYNNANVKPIKIENEITQLKFFNSQTKFWIAASCWEGRVAFISRPQVSQGRNFLMFKKCRCSHQRDVIALDINTENQLVTASIDNVICFWNSFNGVESKKVQLPEEVASHEKAQCIQYVKFPFPEKKDILLIVINNGDCFILETQTEKFMEFGHQRSVNNFDEESMDVDSDSVRSDLNDDTALDSQGRLSSPRRSLNSRDEEELASPQSKHQSFKKSSKARTKKGTLTDSSKVSKYLLGKVAAHSTIDINSGYMVSISENGKGVLNTIKYNNSKKHVNLQAFNCSGDLQNTPITFEEVGRIKMQETPIERDNAVVMVQIVEEYEIIITGQMRGNVNILSLNSCEVLGTFNRGIVNLPKELTDDSPVAEDTQASSEKPRENKLQRAQRVAREICDFKMYKTEKAEWDGRLDDSKQGQNSKFQSDVLESLWKLNSISYDHRPKKIQSTQVKVNTKLAKSHYGSNNAQTISPRPNLIDDSAYFSNAGGTTINNYTTIEQNKNSISFAKDSIDQSAAKAYGLASHKQKASITNKTAVSAGSTNAYSNFK